MTNYREQIADYLAHNLSEADRDAFEMALLEDGELQSAVMIEQALKQGLGKLDGRGGVSPATPAPVSTRSNLALGWALAASLCLGLSVYLNIAQEAPDGRIGSIDQIVYVEPMRSAETTAYTIDADAATLLSVAVSDPRADLVTVVITGSGFETPSESLAVSRDGLVNVVVPRLAPGAYQLTLTNELFEDVYTLDLQ
ncbi:MAG: hypothetical protein AAF933_12310 [Pseudomonadota bacterium]